MRASLLVLFVVACGPAHKTDTTTTGGSSGGTTTGGATAGESTTGGSSGGTTGSSTGGTTTGSSSTGGDTLSIFGCDGSTPIGTPGASFRGVIAYCGPVSADQYYQCDELANRFVRDALSHPAVDNVETQHASSICGNVSASSAYSVYGPGYLATIGQQPVPGDLAVWPGVPGHVAVIAEFKTSAGAYVMQQNEGPPTAVVGWDTSASFFAASDGLECWVHAESAPPLSAPSGPDCGCFAGDGDYCGLAIVNNEAWYACAANISGGGDADYATLYHCTGGVFTASKACANCITADLYTPLGTCQ